MAAILSLPQCVKGLLHEALADWDCSKMADIFQATFWNKSPWLEVIFILLKFAPNRQHAIP